MTFAIITAFIAFVAGLLVRRRIMDYRDAAGPRLTDEHIRQLEAHGYIDIDEPLDLDEIKGEEDRFWDESSWDEI